MKKTLRYAFLALALSATPALAENPTVGGKEMFPTKNIVENASQSADHTTLVAADDPALAAFEALAAQGLIQLRLLPAVGCEAFARHVFDWAQAFAASQTGGRVWVEQVEVAEHDGNAAVYTRV